jgi:general secretion pathway protein G
MRVRLSRSPVRGFTLIELMVVMSLIVLLASIGIATYTNSVTRAKEAVLMEDLFRMRDALDQFYADKNRYPDSLDSLVSEKYLRTLPRDPFTLTTDWQVEMSQPDPTNPSEIPGVFNVKSVSDRTALDGSNYADW